MWPPVLRGFAVPRQAPVLRRMRQGQEQGLGVPERRLPELEPEWAQAREQVPGRQQPERERVRALARRQAIQPPRQAHGLRNANH